MRKVGLAISGLLLLLITSDRAQAYFIPSFDLRFAAWNATDVVVVSQSPKLDGRFIVLDVWKGDLKWGARLNLPVFAKLSEEANRKPEPAASDVVELYPSGRCALLFLRKGKKAGVWRPAMSENWKISFTWIDHGAAYAFVQFVNPGPLMLMIVESRLDRMKWLVEHFSAARVRYQNAMSKQDLRKRASGLAPMLGSPYRWIRWKAIKELQKCERYAVPVIVKAVHDDKFGTIDDLLEGIVKMPGADAGRVFVELIQNELMFWKNQKSPPKSRLAKDWLEKLGQGNKTELRLRPHYWKLSTLIEKLGSHPHPDGKELLLEIKSEWRRWTFIETRRSNNATGVTRYERRLKDALEINRFRTPIIQLCDNVLESAYKTKKSK